MTDEENNLQLLSFVFSFPLASLSALVHQHTLNSLALPIKLVLPTVDVVESYRSASNPQQEAKKMTIKDLLEKGAGKSV